MNKLPSSSPFLPLLRSRIRQSSWGNGIYGRWLQGMSRVGWKAETFDDSTFEATVNSLPTASRESELCLSTLRSSFRHHTGITGCINISILDFSRSFIHIIKRKEQKNHPLNGSFGFLMITGKIRTFLPAEFLLWMPSLFLCNFFSRNCGSQSGRIKGWSRKLLYNLITKFRFLNDRWMIGLCHQDNNCFEESFFSSSKLWNKIIWGSFKTKPKFCK